MATATRTHQTNLLDVTYSTWTNYKTWNVSLYINNDESIYNTIQQDEICCYEDLLEVLFDCGSTETPDVVMWTDPEINRLEINDKVFGL